MRRDISLILVKPFSQSFSVNELRIELPLQQVFHRLLYIGLVFCAVEYQLIEILLKFARQACPVSTYSFQTLIVNFAIARGVFYQTRITLLAALFRTANGWHKELFKMRFKLYFKKTLDTKSRSQMVTPVAVNDMHQALTDFSGRIVITALI